MTTYNTGNPLGSKAAKDLYDNAENLDLLMNGPEDDYPDRFGVARQSWRGMENDFQQVLQDSGYVFIGDYDADGPLLISTRAEVFTKDGEYWRASASLVLPYTTVNNWVIDQPKFVSVGDAVLRGDLNSGDLDKGATIVNGAVRQIDTVAELKTFEGRYAGDVVHLLGYYAGSPGVGGGFLHWDASSVATANDGTVFQVTGVPTGRWLRPSGNGIYMEWFGLKGDGTDENLRVQAAIDATPVGGTLFDETRPITVTMDIPAGQAPWPAAVRINKRMRWVGGRHCTYKLKDFVASYVDYTGVLNPGLTAVRVQSSGVEINGIAIDANADHHYEIVGPDKVWEEGPGGKRPPNGILVLPEIGQPNIDDVKILNCRVDRPLGGVVACGTLSLGGPGLDEVTFFTGQLATDTVVRAEFAFNEVRNARGNDYLFVTGVRNSSIHNNRSINSMYHQARFYAGVESCTMYDNEAFVDYTAIGARWNPTDLGYWRTDNPAGVGAAAYKMERSGFAIGSTSASTSANSGNIRRCSMACNKIYYADNTSGSTIADFSQNTMASFFSWVVTNGIVIDANESYNTPAHGLGAIISVTDPFNNTAQGIVFSNNKVIGAGRRAMHYIGAGFDFHDNEFINCGTNGSGLSICFLQGGSKVYRNSLTWQRTTNNTNNIFEAIAYGPAGNMFISDNTIVGYTGTRMLNASALGIHGTDGGGVALTLLTGWVAGPEPARITMDCAGNVTLEGYINSAAGGSDTFAALDAPLDRYRPRNGQRFPVINSTGTVTLGQATAAGGLVATRGALAAGTSFAVVAKWAVDHRI